MRDWTKTLLRASYGGASFWVERDTADGGRRIVVHEFPHRDGSFNEDLGDSPRHFRVAVYVVGDDADAQAQALIAALSREGPATLVLPDLGVIQARAQKPWSRVRERDRAGLVAFDLNFIRESDQPAATSATYLATLAAEGAGALGDLAAALAASVALVTQPGYVVAAAVGRLQDSVAALETVRATLPTAPAAASALYADLRRLYAAAPASVDNVSGLSPDFVPALFSAAETLGAAAIPVLSAPAFASARAALAPLPTDSYAALAQPSPPASRALAANAAALGQVARLALLASVVQATLAGSFVSRAEAFAARARLMDAFDDDLTVAANSRNVDLTVALQDLRGRVCDWFAKIMLDLAPVVIVRAPRELPSLALAWSLYQDISRARELVDRNAVRHPSFMPEQFEALAA